MLKQHDPEMLYHDTSETEQRMGILKSLRLQRLFRRGIRPFLNELKAGLVALRLGEHTFAVNDFADVEFRCKSLREIILTSDFANEKEALGTFLFLLEPEDVVWDIGAAFGLFAIHSGTICKQVVAFEPDPSSRERLEGNIIANRQQNVASVLPLALSSKVGEIELFTSGLKGNSPSLSHHGTTHSGVVKVQTDTIDEVLSRGVATPDVLKIDVEGAEAQVLIGGEQLLKGHQAPRLIFVEMHPKFLPDFGNTPEQVESILRDAGYSLIATNRRSEQYHIVATRNSE